MILLLFYQTVTSTASYRLRVSPSVSRLHRILEEMKDGESGFSNTSREKKHIVRLDLYGCITISPYQQSNLVKTRDSSSLPRNSLFLTILSANLTESFAW